VFQAAFETLPAPVIGLPFPVVAALTPPMIAPSGFPPLSSRPLAAPPRTDRKLPMVSSSSVPPARAVRPSITTAGRFDKGGRGV
jgi:hypothetical protein